MRLVDSHCHLNLLQVDDIQKVIMSAREQNICHILNVCVNVRDYQSVIETANQFNDVSASFGLHPNVTDEEVSYDEILQQGQAKKVIAIGETGLDYYRSDGDLEWQRERFRIHIRAAIALNKPLIIHTRNAPDDTIQIMKEEKANAVGGVMHCFTESWEIAKQALDLNFSISFSGIVTFPSAVRVQETAKRVPVEHMLVETDAPYLAPIPMRGKPNFPSYVRHTADFIAKLRNIDIEKFAMITTDNFFRQFKGAQNND